MTVQSWVLTGFSYRTGAQSSTFISIQEAVWRTRNYSTQALCNTPSEAGVARGPAAGFPLLPWGGGGVRADRSSTQKHQSSENSPFSRPQPCGADSLALFDVTCTPFHTRGSADDRSYSSAFMCVTCPWTTPALGMGEGVRGSQHGLLISQMTALEKSPVHVRWPPNSDLCLVSEFPRLGLKPDMIQGCWVARGLSWVILGSFCAFEPLYQKVWQAER